MNLKLKVPRLSTTTVEAAIIGWHPQPDRSVARVDRLHERQTEQDGTLPEIPAGDGADVEVGDPVCQLEYGP